MVTSVVHEPTNIITSFHYGAIHFRFAYNETHEFACLYRILHQIDF